MNITESNLTATEQALLNVWCDNVRAVRAEVGRAMVANDPRQKELEKRFGDVSDFTPEEVGDAYFIIAKPELCFVNFKPAI